MPQIQPGLQSACTAVWLPAPKKDCRLVFVSFSAVVLALACFVTLLFVYLIEVI